MKILFLIILLIISPTFLCADVIISDNFEYAVGRDDDDKSAFTTSGPWTGWKSRPLHPGAYGFTYTTTSIPGFSGAFPGTNSSRVLASEHLPGTYEWGQSDTYLSFFDTGEGNQPIPATFYLQFWVYFQYYGDQLSSFQNGKFLYPCGDDVQTGTCGVQHHDWMTQFRKNYSGETFELTTEEAGHVYIYMKTEGTASMVGEGETTGNLGPNQSQATAIFHPNTWYLLKFYYDFSTNDPIYRMWRKTVTDESFTLIAEYVDGTTQGLTWTPYTNSGYYRLNFLEMNDQVDCWFYVDDFIIATSENDLPTYSSGGGSSNQSITGATFSGATLH